MGSKRIYFSKIHKRNKRSIALRAHWKKVKAALRPPFESVQADINTVSITHDYCRITCPDPQAMEYYPEVVNHGKIVDVCDTKQEYNSMSAYKLHTCRTCKQESPNMKTIFRKDRSSDCFINEMLMACASIKVHRQDGLPQVICLRCYTLLKQSFLFKKKCEDTDKFLRKYVEASQKGVLKDNHNGYTSDNMIDIAVEETVQDRICETDVMLDEKDHGQDLLKPIRIEKVNVKTDSGKVTKNIKSSKYHNNLSKEALVESNTMINCKISDKFCNILEDSQLHLNL